MDTNGKVSNLEVNFQDGHYSSIYGDSWFYDTVREAMDLNKKDFEEKYPDLYKAMNRK